MHPQPDGGQIVDELRLSGGAPVALPNVGQAWQVRDGMVEAYLVWSAGRRLLAVVEKGGVVFPATPHETKNEAFPAEQLETTEVLLVAPEGALLVPVQHGDVALISGAEDWLIQASQRLSTPPPQATEAKGGTVAPGDVLSARGEVLWISPGPNVELTCCGVGPNGSRVVMMAVTGSLWAGVVTGGEISVKRTAELELTRLIPAVASATAAFAWLAEAEEASADRVALNRLGAKVGRTAQVASASMAIRDICTSLRLDQSEVREPPEGASDLPLPALCRVAGLRAREVKLEAGWQHRDHGHLIARPPGAQGEAYHALLWDGSGYRYQGGPRLDAETAASYAHHAYAVSTPLPRTVSGLWSLAFHIMRQGNRRDALLAAAAAAVSAGLGILIPLATAWLLSDIVPSGTVGLLIAVGVALGCASLVTAILASARALATTRISGRGATVLGTALTDRILRLPARFFKNFSAGDLNQRLENIEAMRALAVSVLMSAGLTAVLSVVYLVVLFTYDVRLALIGAALVAGYILAVVAARVLQMEAIREATQLDGQIAGLTYETLEGVPKLRAAAAEDRALSRWLEIYAKERAAGVRAGRVGTNFGAFADAYQTITMMTLFAGAGALAAVDAPAGIFIGFLAAFGSFQGAFVGLSQALLEVYAAQPLVERARPVLEAETEVDPGRADPGQLIGEIEGSGLTFAYGDGLPSVLNGLDFLVRPGQHMAIVGGSGSGKSTLLRLLLGFETPQRGAILYDGQDLARLDLTRVRSQIGVVLQASQLFAGSILENIRGAGSASLEDCLIAAEKAGLKRDLEYFAMGIHTPITEGAGALSGGQRQRILIARALAAKPNILFFDEATSALDNETQAMVSKTLDALDVTRVTIAHRLSTVRHADRICVMDAGRFVEQGTFDDLMAKDGAFATLARRQLTGE